MCDDVAFLVGVEPLDVGVAFEPHHLFAGVGAGVLFDFFDGFVEGAQSVEELEEFFVADGVEGVESFVGVDAPDFLEEAFVHHCMDALVDALVEFFSVSVETDFDDMEGSGFLGVRAEEGIGFAGSTDDFDGVGDALVVLMVGFGEINGVADFEFGKERGEPFGFVEIVDLLSDIVGDGRHGDTFANGVDIECRAA